MGVQNLQVDVLIAGGGIVGTTLAVALKGADRSLEVAVVERTSAAPADDRASAVAASGRRMLEELGVWPALADSAQPIREMIVTDSSADDSVRPVFLTFDGALESGEAFAQMVPNASLRQALGIAASDVGVTWIEPDSVDQFVLGETGMIADLASGTKIETKLLVAADGVRSRLRERAGIRTTGWDYGQTGLVATIEHEKPHHGRAEEHFLPSGPFAVLPLKGNRASLVWTEERAEAKRLLDTDTPALNAEITKRIGHHLGAVGIIGRLQSFPLGLRLAREFVRPRFCLVGDAAHAIHPLAGQGLNLGLRDVAALAETLVEARRLGLDIGQTDVLERYQAWRRFDVAEMGALTDGLNRLFSNDVAPIRMVRDIGLGLVNRIPLLKRMMIDQAAGLGSEAPRLLRGEAI